MGSFIEEEIRKIREQVGDGRVLCASAGGVDSSVLAVLIHRAIGEKLVSIFVDNGLLRQGEVEEVTETFRGRYHLNFRVIHAREQVPEKIERGH